ncbi:uncharacterized protein conserved in archaea [Methylophaga frappieri]|uniref:Uncharacterized protein conserved in archaea n=1 Tax=Methylophaga frappieri (strain ATCC BAA-2434 / DSM 25690 / JAM7) TaxID=754477 RepID=I1YH53_METFJ|nr:ATP-dependent zinc protease [Methylophaga frappieri]AFJ02246.1 uncharacterized protein conserved in archaea [Methylophaga frappieri]
MNKLKLSLMMVTASIMTGCLQQPQNSLTPAQLQTALLEAENRMEEKWRNHCTTLIDNQKTNYAGLNDIKSGQKGLNRKLDEISQQLNEQPEPVVITSPSEPAKSCPTVAPATVNDKLILGRTEWIWLEPVNRVFRARVDSGATTSSLSAHHIVEFERDGQRWVRFNMVPDDDVDDSYEVEAPLVRVAKIRQASSDELDRRLVVELTMKVGDFTDTAEFTLTDRTAMTYPILLGREFLRDIALIDVAKSYHQPKPEPIQGRPESAPDADVETDN